MKLLSTTSVLAVAALAVASPQARAADLGTFYGAPDDYVPPDQQLTLGTGWYLRGDAAVSDETLPLFKPARTRFTDGREKVGYGLGVGVGYKLNSFLRFDVTGDYLDPLETRTRTTCPTTCTSRTAGSELWRYDGLLNGYLDLGSWWGFTPYVGGGAGLAGTHADMPRRTVGTRTLGEENNEGVTFAWAGMAGVSYAFTNHLMLDVGYRYLDLGRATVVTRSTSATTRQDITAHQARVGLRYMID